MSDTIYRDDAIRVASGYCHPANIAKELAKLPPAQKIIRCKDCIHCADDWNGNQPMHTCELAMCRESVQPNDFCSKAERREESNDQ